MTPAQKTPEAERGLVDSVLLIDGDNDPHIPPDFVVTPSTLVRVFLRPDGKLPKPLERRLAALPMFVTVASTKGGANAADFVMSLHVGILHATLPLHLPFTVVTADRSLSVVTQELQRVGRRANIWTSHPERGGRGKKAETAAEEEAAAPASSSSSRSRRGRGHGRGRRSGSRRAAAPAAAAATPSEASVAPVVPIPAAAGGRSLAEVAAAYAARLARIKDPPSRLKTLINDIANRAGASGYTPELILDELKLRHGVVVDESGRVKLTPPNQGA